MDIVRFRDATSADREFVYRVKEAAFREYVEQVGGWDDAEQRRLHEERFRAQRFRIVVVGAEGADVDVGFIAGGVEPDCVRVNQLFVLPEHQGGGVGRMCMELAMDEARGLGLPVRLRVLKVNPRALAFYDRLGFYPIGETDTHDLMEWWP